MEVLGRTGRLTLTEGRYHQMRRMFAKAGNHVESLHRSRTSSLALDDLAAVAWRVLDTGDIAALFAKRGER